MMNQTAEITTEKASYLFSMSGILISHSYLLKCDD